jgi:twitching motility protein PilT
MGKHMPTVEDLLAQIATQPYSDVHLVCGQVPLLRVHGDLQAVSPCEPLSAQSLADFRARALQPSRLSSYELQGDADASLSLGAQRFRLNFFKASSGDGCALRRLSDSIPSMDALQLPPALRACLDLDKGLVLVTGSTGSGKSTTLASLLDEVNRTRPLHVLTLEDPIEYLHPSGRALVSQREVGTDMASFAEGLRAALREDPDIILVGEMRDPETITLALTAAETGHLVFATLHTRDTSSAISRILDSLPVSQQNQARNQLSQALEVVVTQHLHKRIDQPGRVASFEVLVCNDAVRNLIRQDKLHEIANVLQTNKKSGMQTMQTAIHELALAGLIAPGSNAAL